MANAVCKWPLGTMNNRRAKIKMSAPLTTANSIEAPCELYILTCLVSDLQKQSFT